MSSQQAATGVGSGRGDYETPDDLFAMLDLRVGGFTLDAAASHENTKVPALYCTTEGTFENAHGEHFFRDSATGLTYRWTDERVFVNPPYTRGALEPFMAKCADERNSAAAIVALIPVATDTAWWHEHVRPYATIHYLRGRVKFLLDGVEQGSPPGGVCVAEFLPDWLNGGKR